MKIKNNPRLSNQTLRILTAVLLAVLIFGLSSKWQAQAESPLPADPDGQSATVGPINCSVEFVAVFTNRVVVRCTVPVETIIFDFAIATDPTNSQQANRMLVLLNTAYALNTPVFLYYSNNSGDNPPGCLTNTCRRLESLYVQ